MAARQLRPSPAHGTIESPPRRAFPGGSGARRVAVDRDRARNVAST